MNSFFTEFSFRLLRDGAGFTGTVNKLAFLSLALSTGVLFLVLSIVNGFEEELEERLLTVVPQVSLSSETGFSIKNIRESFSEMGVYGLSGLAPVAEGAAVIASKDELRPIKFIGFDSAEYVNVSNIGDYLGEITFPDLDRVKFGVVVGSSIAERMALSVGDFVTLIVPRFRISLFGQNYLQKQFEIVDTFATGSSLDSTTVFVSLSSAQRMLRFPDSRVNGLHGSLKDPFLTDDARGFLDGLLIPNAGRALSWKSYLGNLYQAIAVQKATLFLLFSILIGVGCFNLFSSMTMLVQGQASSIAILRTNGAMSRKIVYAFVLLGLALAIFGAFLGVLLGGLFGVGLVSLLPLIEQLIGFNPMSQYFIDYLPLSFFLADVALIFLLTILLSFFAVIFPAWRAGQSPPAEVLAYE